MHRGIYKIISCVILALILVAGCKVKIENAESNFPIHFTTSDTTKNKSLCFDEVRGVGGMPLSACIDSVKNVMLMPMNIKDTMSTYIFTKGSIHDTIAITYKITYDDMGYGYAANIKKIRATSRTLKKSTHLLFKSVTTKSCVQDSTDNKLCPNGIESIYISY